MSSGRSASATTGAWLVISAWLLVGCSASNGSSPTGSETTSSVPTYVRVTQRPLVTTRLGSGTVVPLSSETVTTGGSGTITTPPNQGRGLMQAGEILARIDERPFVLLPGRVPTYRDLSLSTGGQPLLQGRDVMQLETFLAAEGFDPGDVDGVYTVYTDISVSRFRESVALPTTVHGLARSEFAFVVLPPPWRISTVIAGRGVLVSEGSPIAVVTGSGAAVRVTPPPIVEGRTRIQVDHETWTAQRRLPDGDLVLGPRTGSSSLPFGRPVTVSFETTYSSHAIAVPVGAVRRAPDGTDYVLCGEQRGQAHACPVALKEVIGDRVVVSGLEVPTWVQVGGE